MMKFFSKTRLISPYTTDCPDTKPCEKADESLPLTEIRSRISEAITIFYLRDSYLVYANANERSMTFRLGMYLQQLFPLWDVDCEYNRNSNTFNENKLLYVRCNHPHKFDCAHCSNQRCCTVFPDIIIHKRGTDGNLLVIEAKKKASSNSEEKDIEKIKAYLEEETLKYKYGLFIDFRNSAFETIKCLQWFPPNITTGSLMSKDE